MTYNVTSYNINIYVRCECGRYLTWDFLKSLTDVKCECGSDKCVVMSKEDFIQFERNKKIEKLGE